MSNPNSDSDPHSEAVKLVATGVSPYKKPAEDPQWIGWFFVVFALIAAPIAYYQNVIVPQQAQKLVDDAPLVTAADLPKYAGKAVVVKFEVVPGKAKYRFHNLVYKRVSCWEVTGSSRSQTYWGWIKHSSAPDMVQFTCADSNVPIYAKGDELNVDYLDLYFLDVGKKTNAAIDDETNYTIARPTAFYQELGLPALDKLSVWSCVEKQGNGYKLTPFKYKGEKYFPIVCSLDLRSLHKYIDSSLTPETMPALNHWGRSSRIPEGYKTQQ